jgi:putative ABC transport system permease protein
VTNSAFEPAGFGNTADVYTVPDDVSITDESFPTFQIELHSPETGQTQTVTVIGVVATQVSTLSGLYLPQPVFDSLYDSPDTTQLYVQQTDAAADSDALAREIESALQTSGVQAESIQARIEEQVSFANGFFQLLQGFMGLGLFVGIAALGVISFRSVVERRQQIGMLRAIGYQRNMVAASFLIESLVVATLGVLSGTLLAVVLSYNLIAGGQIEEGTQFSGFVIPWSTIVFFIAAALIAAALMTWIPARKAAAEPIAEALRYE